MLEFDLDKSQRLGNGILNTLSQLVKEHELARGEREKYKFFLREREIVYALFKKVNSERQVI